MTKKEIFLSMERICAVCCGEIHLGSVRSCMNMGCHCLKGHKVYLLSVFLFLFCLIETVINLPYPATFTHIVHWQGCQFGMTSGMKEFGQSSPVSG